jgi:hypothetical protein
MPVAPNHRYTTCYQLTQIAHLQHRLPYRAEHGYDHHYGPIGRGTPEGAQRPPICMISVLGALADSVLPTNGRSSG